MTGRNLEALGKRLGVEFQNVELLRQALTHRSAQGPNNERLEFLGDAILGFVVADVLFRSRESANEGELSRLRASLVNQTTLADVARELGLGDYLILGPGELKSGGFRRDSILSDAFEAIIGALLIDQGLDSARRWVEGMLSERIATLSDAAAHKDSKTRLQELLQGRNVELPLYQLLAATGSPHQQEFLVECHVAAVAGAVTRGAGSTRKRAEQEAAALMLEFLVREVGWS